MLMCYLPQMSSLPPLQGSQSLLCMRRGLETTGAGSGVCPTNKGLNLCILGENVLIPLATTKVPHAAILHSDLGWALSCMPITLKLALKLTLAPRRVRFKAIASENPTHGMPPLPSKGD